MIMKLSELNLVLQLRRILVPDFENVIESSTVDNIRGEKVLTIFVPDDPKGELKIQSNVNGIYDLHPFNFKKFQYDSNNKCFKLFGTEFTITLYESYFIYKNETQKYTLPYKYMNRNELLERMKYGSPDSILNMIHTSKTLKSVYDSLLRVKFY